MCFLHSHRQTRLRYDKAFDQMDSETLIRNIWQYRCFQADHSKFLDRLVTTDETWVHHSRHSVFKNRLVKFFWSQNAITTRFLWSRLEPSLEHIIKICERNYSYVRKLKKNYIKNLQNVSSSCKAPLLLTSRCLNCKWNWYQVDWLWPPSLFSRFSTVQLLVFSWFFPKHKKAF